MEITGILTAVLLYVITCLALAVTIRTAAAMKKKKDASDKEKNLPEETKKTGGKVIRCTLNDIMGYEFIRMQDCTRKGPSPTAGTPPRRKSFRDSVGIGINETEIGVTGIDNNTGDYQIPSKKDLPDPMENTAERTEREREREHLRERRRTEEREKEREKERRERVKDGGGGTDGLSREEEFPPAGMFDAPDLKDIDTYLDVIEDERRERKEEREDTEHYLDKDTPHDMEKTPAEGEAENYKKILRDSYRYIDGGTEFDEKDRDCFAKFRKMHDEE